MIEDYKSLKSFITTKKLSRRQVCEAKFLLRFNFVIFYTLGKKNRKADILTCRPNDFLANDQDN